MLYKVFSVEDEFNTRKGIHDNVDCPGSRLSFHFLFQKIQ